jgi:ParB family chromosome partitioning protein
MADMADNDPLAWHLPCHASSTQKRCEVCDTLFEVEIPRARFCGGTCRKKAHRLRLNAEAYRGHLRTSASHEWHTPAEIVDLARHVLGGIELDPASCEAANRVVRADHYYDEHMDGLTRPWSGRVFLNPPYGRLAPSFARKFAGHYPHDVPRAILVLANHHLSTAWFSTSLAVLEPATCIMNYRLRFSGSASQPTHGSVILGFGVDETRFREVFAPHGWVR